MKLSTFFANLKSYPYHRLIAPSNIRVIELAVDRQPVTHHGFGQGRPSAQSNVDAGLTGHTCPPNGRVWRSGRDRYPQALAKSLADNDGPDTYAAKPGPDRRVIVSRADRIATVRTALDSSKRGPYLPSSRPQRPVRQQPTCR